MDGFMFFGGVGGLALAGLCYSVYRNIQDAASHLKVLSHLISLQIKIFRAMCH